MSVNVDALTSEIRDVIGALDVSWADFANYLKAKMMEAALSGGVTSYTINGRTVAKDLRWWQDAHAYAKQQAAVETSGGIDHQPIRFARRV